MKEIEDRLRTIWSAVLMVDEVPPDADFFSLGGDSLSLLRLLDRVEAQWGVSYSHSAFLADPTLRGMARGIGGERPVERRPALFSIVARGERPPLFLVTAGYGDLVSFRTLAHALGPGFPVHACQPPDTLPPDAGLDALVACYRDAILEVRPRGPYHLAGYSVGGLVALDVANALLDLGHEVALLALLDTEPGYKGLRRHAVSLTRAVLPRVLGKEPWRWGRVARVAQFVVEDEGFDTHVRVTHDRSTPAYSGRMTLVLPRISQQRFFRGAWREIARGGLDVHLVPGDHENFIRPPRVTHVASILRQALEATGDSRRRTRP